MKFTSKLTAACCVALGFALFPVLSDNVAQAATQKGVINASRVNLREQATVHADVLVRLDKGKEVTVKSKKGDWYRVSYGKYTGYIHGEYVTVKSSASSSSSGSSGYVTLKYKDKGDAVKKLQEALRKAGFLKSRADGYFGSDTLKAVKSFQSKHGLKVDGIAGKQTQKLLFESSSSSSSGYATLKYKDKGDAVKKLQKALRDLGFLKSRADGIFGMDTLKAVKSFQSKNGLKADGIAGKQTQRVLYGKSPSSASSSSSSSTTLKMGSEGKAVVDLQTKLKNKGYYTYKVTGVFGSITRSAVISFQKDVGLKADGIAGPLTLKKLNSSSTKKKSSSSSSSKSSSSSSRSQTDGSGRLFDVDPADVIAYAKKFIGIPYRYGGDDPSGFDCSGFTKYVFGHFGIKLPRSSKAQASAGVAVSPSKIKPGDLLLFGNPIHHVGIYVGNNQYIHSPRTGEKIKISKLNRSYQARRLLK